MDFWNSLHLVRSMSTDWKAKEHVSGAGRPMGIHRIAKSSNVVNAWGLDSWAHSSSHSEMKYLTMVFYIRSHTFMI